MSSSGENSRNYEQEDPFQQMRLSVDINPQLQKHAHIQDFCCLVGSKPQISSSLGSNYPPGPTTQEPFALGAMPCQYLGLDIWDQHLTGDIPLSGWPRDHDAICTASGSTRQCFHSSKQPDLENQSNNTAKTINRVLRPSMPSLYVISLDLYLLSCY